MKSWIWIAIVFLFLPARAYCAQADSALIEKMKNAYESTKAFNADFTQKLSHRESGSTETRKGTLHFAKPMNIRWETGKPNAETLVINSSEIWDYIPDEGVAYRYAPEVAQDSRNIAQVLTGQAKLTQDFNVKSLGNENGRAKLALYPKEATPQMVEATIWVDPQGGFIRKALVTDFYGNTNEVELNSFSTNAGADARIFKFSPPKGIDIEDLRNKELPERELFK